VWTDAEVVGVGWTARTVRGLHLAAHGLVRLLVERHGFRAVSIEGDPRVSAALDEFVRTGVGDPRATLARARSFLATEELLALVLWVRRYNERNEDTQVRVVHGSEENVSTSDAIERGLADQITTWLQQNGDRIVHVGGAFHTAVARTRRTRAAAGPVAPSAGARLRDRFGQGYLSVGLTFGSGSIPQPVPPPAPRFIERWLDDMSASAVFLSSAELRRRIADNATDCIRTRSSNSGRRPASPSSTDPPASNRPGAVQATL
jgi:erythromycin esterase